jgi:tetratricopeptide (TPR) repeat protein
VGNTAHSLNNLSSLYQAQGRYAEAEPLLRRAISICEQQLGPEHPITALSLNNLSSLYQAQGKYTEAELLLQRAVSIREQQLGADHPDTATSINDLAGLYRSQSKYEQAQPLYLQALAIREQQLGANHPDTATSINDLALLFEDQRKQTEAESLYLRALAIREQQLGADHPSTLQSLSNLAKLYQKQGKNIEAESLLRKVQATYDQQLSPEDSSMAPHSSDLATPVSDMLPPSSEQRPLSRFGVSFPEIWNVPRRHIHFFTGRDHLLEQLFDGFRSENTGEIVSPQALIGLGGIGKTQAVAEYAYRYRAEYQAILWVRAETREDLMTDFKTIAGLLNLPQDHLQDQARLLQTMQEWFQNHSDWLLIFDNADDPELVASFLPRAGQGHVLLTTRDTSLQTLAKLFVLDPLKPEDGALCILRRAGYLPRNGQLSDATPAGVNAARTLSQLMDGLPLALEQAGAYIEETGRSVSGYLELYQRYRSEIQRSHDGAVPNYLNSVASAWRITKSLVEQTNPAAAELLRLCAFLPPGMILDKIFTRGAANLGPILSPLATIHLLLIVRLGS